MSVRDDSPPRAGRLHPFLTFLQLCGSAVILVYVFTQDARWGYAGFGLVTPPLLVALRRRTRRRGLRRLFHGLRFTAAATMPALVGGWLVEVEISPPWSHLLTLAFLLAYVVGARLVFERIRGS
jgi:hypothetical protein